MSAVGLCENCRHVRVVRTKRGSEFYQCGKALTDPSLKKYPPLPVSECPAYEPSEPQGSSGA